MAFAVVSGIPFKHLHTAYGFEVSKNTWTSYVKDVGVVCSEALERNRRDPNNKWDLAQWDECAFGKRKYNRGKRQRAFGIQWGLTGVLVNYAFLFIYFN